MTENPEKFTCEMCGGEFDKGRSDEEALGDLAAGPWSDVPEEECAVVCEDCYLKLGSPNEARHVC